MCVNLSGGAGFVAAGMSDITAVRDFLNDFVAGKLVKSEDRPLNDADAEHPELTVVTTKSFDEIVLDPNAEIFMDI